MIEITINVTNATEDEKRKLRELYNTPINKLPKKEVVIFYQDDNVEKLSNLTCSSGVGLRTMLSFQSLEDITPSDTESFFLTKEMIKQCATSKGGFTTAQVEYLGLSLKENWIDKAVKLRISKEQLLKFKAYGGVNSKELKQLKSMNSFFNIHNQIVQ